MLLEGDSDNRAVLHLKGMMIAALGDYEQALLYFDMSLQSKESRIFEWTGANAFASKSMALFALNRFDEAIENIDKAIELIPINALFLSGKATMLGVNGDHEGALLYFEKVLEMYPFHVEALIGKGVALSYLDRPDESIFYYDKALEIEPDNEYAKRNKEIAMGKID